jgi:phenylacetate-coenzyme A ligase PaaK-like adenylate-forming protein
MRLDFSDALLKRTAFSEKPMSFIDQEPKNQLAAVIDLVAIETGNRAAREYWQQKQLENLLRHAAQRSAFWRKRIGAKKISGIKLSDLPILTRSDLTKQVETEGSLVPHGANARVRKHTTSGSSGTPVEFFVSELNGHYNQIRSIAQYFIEGRDLTLNRTRFKPSPDRIEGGFVAAKTSGWLGPLSALFKTGFNKEITHLHPNRDLLFKELRKDPIGYLVIQPRLVETLFPGSDVSFLAENGTHMFIPVAEEADKSLRDKFAAAKIAVRSNYSSEEFGWIGAECEDCPETYHVTESNVIVEVDNRNSMVVNGNRLGRVLVTHLHSYATPFLRYDIGDFATFAKHCQCGHDGPTLSNVYGLKKRLLKRADGSIVPFSMKAGHILKIVKCDEYRIRQIDVDTITLEIGGIDQLTTEQIAALTELFKKHAGDEFHIGINAVRKIDWGTDVKKLGFRSEVI